MSNKTPLVSVIIPTYNRAHLVGRAVRSVLAQTYQDFELIVVDDASTDNTKEVMNSFSDERIKYVCHKENKGGSAARNTGIKMAKGMYIALLDDDDEWLPTKLEKQVKKIKEVPDRVGLVYSGSEIREVKDNIIHKIYHPEFKGDVHKQLLLGSTIGSVSKVLVKKECFRKVGLFDESLKSCQDWDMWKRIADCYEFDFVPEVLTRIYLHNSQISSNFKSLISGRTRMIEKHIDDFKKHPKILVIHLKRLGKLHCINGTYKEAIYWFKEALKVNIFEIIKILAWCIIELPRVKFFSRAKDFKKYRIEKNRGAMTIVSIYRRILDIIQDPKTVKRRHALYHWKARKKIEGVLSNSHYEYFYTIHFGLDSAFYEDKKILDIGCGPRGSLEWADMAAQRIGLDPYAVDYRKLGTDRHKMKYVAAYAEKMPFPDKTFDVVCSFNSLDHVDNIDQTINEIIRVIAPGGLFLLLTDVRWYSTICESQVFSWDIVERFTPRLKLIDVKHYEEYAGGMYESIRERVPYDHMDKSQRKGILSAKFIKIE